MNYIDLGYNNLLDKSLPVDISEGITQVNADALIKNNAVNWEKVSLKMNTDIDNGLWISPSGIVGKKNGSVTFQLDIEGNATFSGSISASDITGGTIIGTEITAGNATGARLLLNKSGYVGKMRVYSDYTEGQNFCGSIYGYNGGSVAQGIFLDGQDITVLAVNGATIAYANSTSFAVSSGKDLQAQWSHIDNIVLGDNSPLAENGSMYSNGSSLYVRLSGVWRTVSLV